MTHRNIENGSSEHFSKEKLVISDYIIGLFSL